MPDDSKKKREDEEELKDDDDDDEETESLLGDEKRRLNEMKANYGQGDKFGGTKTPFAQDRVNITEEVNKTGIWLQVRRDSMPNIRDPDQNNGGLHNRKNGSREKKAAEKTSFFVGEDKRTPLKEEHEEDDMV